MAATQPEHNTQWSTLGTTVHTKLQMIQKFGFGTGLILILFILASDVKLIQHVMWFRRPQLCVRELVWGPTQAWHTPVMPFDLDALIRSSGGSQQRWMWYGLSYVNNHSPQNHSHTGATITWCYCRCDADYPAAGEFLPPWREIRWHISGIYSNSQAARMCNYALLPLCLRTESKIILNSE